MKCTNCGTEMEETARFCPKCGMEVLPQPNENVIQNEQRNDASAKKPFMKRLAYIFLAIAVVLVIVLCIIFKYKILLPVILLMVAAAVIAVIWIILRKSRRKGSQEIAQCVLADSDINKFSPYFVNRDEKYISSLGNGYLMNFLANGTLRRGFAVISNKRVYFKGSCFSGSGKSLVKTDEERTVDVKDITGSGFIYRRYIGILLCLFSALIVLIAGISFTAMGMSGAWRSTISDQRSVDELRNKIEEIDHSDKMVESINEKLEENNASIEEMQARLSELESLQGQKIFETALENMSLDEFLYDTEINAAYEEYLYELDDAFRYSDLWNLLSEVRDTAYDIKYASFSGTSYLESAEYKERADWVIDELDNLYGGYEINGNLLVEYYNAHNSLYIDPVTYCTDIIGIPYDMIQLAYAILDNYNAQNAHTRPGYFECAIAFGWADSDAPYIEPYSRQSADLYEAFNSAYQKFIDTVAPSYLESENAPTLAEVVLDYVSTHPDASFAAESGLFGITTEYDSDINELKNQISGIYENNDSLNEELADVQEEINNRSQYEDSLARAKTSASKAFALSSMMTALAGLLLTFLISCFLIFLNYLRKRKTLFQIQYAGGSIAFDVSYYAKAEIDDFQKQLRRIKDLAAESAEKITAAAPFHQAAAQSSAPANVPDDLRKYADLLKDGLISQEEYDALKKKTLGL